MRDNRAPPDVADVNRARLVERRWRETQYVRSERQVGAGASGDARHVLEAMTETNEDVVELGQRLEQILQLQILADFGDEAGCLAAALALIGNKRKRMQF